MYFLENASGVYSSADNWVTQRKAIRKVLVEKWNKELFTYEKYYRFIKRITIFMYT